MIPDLYLEVKTNLLGTPKLKFSSPNLFPNVWTLIYFVEPVQHEKIKLKPPIPRINSKTPTKNSE